MRTSSNYWEAGTAFVAVSIVFFFLMRKVWFRYAPMGRLYWLLALACFAMASASGPFITAPSSAPRLTTTGQLWEVHRIPTGKIHFNEFLLGQMDGTSFLLQTPIDPSRQGKYGPYLHVGETVQVQYLNEKREDGLPPRAINIEILDGPYAGWHDSVDANWFGLWLLLPIGILGALVSIGFATKNLSPGERKRIEKDTPEATSYGLL